jgi:hypothetical protein
MTTFPWTDDCALRIRGRRQRCSSASGIIPSETFRAVLKPASLGVTIEEGSPKFTGTMTANAAANEGRSMGSTVRFPGRRENGPRRMGRYWNAHFQGAEAARPRSKKRQMQNPKPGFASHLEYPRPKSRGIRSDGLSEQPDFWISGTRRVVNRIGADDEESDPK